ncbi:MAG: heavy-metal-associated domain-containing protein [Candidatus Schekmanbacteria bacterium]|nr:heavy-metal-associated domain-containing protein [Candidatus Schekmanbacteria bacterium]
MHPANKVARDHVAWRALLVLAVAAAVGLAACACNDRATPPPPASAAEAAFSVQGMTCASCAVAVRAAAKGVPGVYDARADAEQGSAWASYDAQRTTVQAIARAISDAGYPATAQ